MYREKKTSMDSGKKISKARLKETMQAARNRLVDHFSIHSYLEVSSVQSCGEVFPDFHQFRSRAPWTSPLFDGVLLQVRLKLAFPL